MIENIKQLINNGETGTVEFKRSTASLKSAAQALCAFLNGDGGTVFIGVTDGGKIVGQHITDQTKLEIANILKKFEPTANINVDYIPVGEKANQVVVFKALPDPRCIPYSFDGRPYERNESQTHLMSQNRYQQLLLSRHLNPHDWESQFATNITIDDLDSEEIAQTLTDMSHKQRIDAIVNEDSNLDILKRLKLVELDQITNAAVILFCKDIPSSYIQCVLRMARFRGTEKGDFIDSRHVFGNAFQLLREAEQFINKNMKIASNLKTGKLARDDQPEYPFDAVREALINAICHRDYTSPGGSITISMYDDRLEIANTGLLPPGITLNELKKAHTSHPRNPRIINVFFRRGLIEAMGIGTQEIIKSCLNVHMREPEFFEQAGAFVTRLWSRHYQGLTHQEMETLTIRQQAILKVLGDKQLAPSEILDLLEESISERTLRRELKLLKEQGYLDTEGAQGWDRRWFIVKPPPT